MEENKHEERHSEGVDGNDPRDRHITSNTTHLLTWYTSLVFQCSFTGVVTIRLSARSTCIVIITASSFFGSSFFAAAAVPLAPPGFLRLRKSCIRSPSNTTRAAHTRAKRHTTHTQFKKAKFEKGLNKNWYYHLPRTSPDPASLHPVVCHSGQRAISRAVWGIGRLHTVSSAENV